MGGEIWPVKLLYIYLVYVYGDTIPEKKFNLMNFDRKIFAQRKIFRCDK